jgi:hypothetical protein
MIYRILADAVLAVHLLYVVFVVTGGLLAARLAWVAWLHLPAAAWGAAVELFGFWCPLTPLENAFRTRAGIGGYEEGFIEHYLLPLLYPGALTREIQIGLGAGVVVLNGLVYAWIWRRRRGRRRP